MKCGTFRYSDLLRTPALLKWNRKLIGDVSGCRVENWHDIVTTQPMILPFNMKFGMPMQTHGADITFHKNAFLVLTIAATLWWFTAAPKPLQMQVFGSPSPQGSYSPYILGDTTRPGHVTCVL